MRVGLHAEYGGSHRCQAIIGQRYRAGILGASRPYLIAAWALQTLAYVGAITNVPEVARNDFGRRV